MKKKAREYVMELIADAQARLASAVGRREAWRAVEDLGEARTMLQDLDEYCVACRFIDEGDSIDSVHPPGGIGGWSKGLDLSDEQGQAS